MSEEMRIVLDGENVTIEDIVKIARFNYKAALSDEAADKIRRSRAVVENIVETETRTYGINTGVDDPVPVSAGLVYGKYVARLPAAGSFLVFLKEPQGYIICILIPFLLLILYHGIKTIKLFRQYKKEQNAELQAERDEIAAERAESQRMLEELAALKAQLAAQGGATPADSEPVEPQAASTESEPTEPESTEETPSKDAE